MNIRILLLIFICVNILSCNIYEMYYGKSYNTKRKKLGIVEIPNDWTLTKKTSTSLRYSTVNTLKELNIIFEKENYKGHIEKFIFWGNEHYEIDNFLIIDNKKQIKYTMYHYQYNYSNKEKKCECYDATENDKIINHKKINCNIVDSLFFR